MKILYAANNSRNSYFQLKRFLSSIKHKNIDVRVAAYRSSAGDLNIDYTLDALLNFTNPDANISFNGNYTFLFNEIKRFTPDLIISDLEVYVSIIASEMQIPLWIISPLLLYSALDKKTIYNIGIHKEHSYILNKNFRKKSFINFIINNANRRFITSHLCDTNIEFHLKKGFEFIRPDFVLADQANHDIDYLIVAANNKNVIDNYKDKNAVMLTDYIHEQYQSLKLYSIYDDTQYKMQLGRCQNFVCDGSALLAADAFYNELPCIYHTAYDSIESIIVSRINEYYGKRDIKINNNIKFLSEHLDINGSSP